MESLLSEYLWQLRISLLF